MITNKFNISSIDMHTVDDFINYLIQKLEYPSIISKLS